MKRKKWNYNLTIGLILTTIVVLMAVIGHFWTPYGPTDMNSMLKNAPPTLAHPFGNDNFGRDILSRIMNGMGTTCFVAPVSYTHLQYPVFFAYNKRSIKNSGLYSFFA